MIQLQEPSWSKVFWGLFFNVTYYHVGKDGTSDMGYLLERAIIYKGAEEFIEFRVHAYSVPYQSSSYKYPGVNSAVVEVDGYWYIRDPDSTY